jgi:hypothetical protein
MTYFAIARTCRHSTSALQQLGVHVHLPSLQQPSNHPCEDSRKAAPSTRVLQRVGGPQRVSNSHIHQEEEAPEYRCAQDRASAVWIATPYRKTKYGITTPRRIRRKNYPQTQRSHLSFLYYCTDCLSAPSRHIPSSPSHEQASSPITRPLLPRLPSHTIIVSIASLVGSHPEIRKYCPAGIKSPRVRCVSRSRFHPCTPQSWDLGCDSEF